MLSIGLAEICIIAIVGIGILLAINYFAVSRQEARDRALGIVKPPPSVDWSAIRDSQLQEFMAQNQKINAIKRYRELTRQGLKEAKDAIEFAEANPGMSEKKKAGAYDAPDAGVRDLVRDGEIERAVEAYRVFSGVDEYTARDAIKEIEREIRLEDEAPESPASGKPNTAEIVQIRDLLRQGDKIEAIKLYRQITGLGLKEAKDVIDAMGNDSLL